THVVRITDANAPADLAAALRGGGMFEESRVVVLNGILANEEMRTMLFDSLAQIRDSEETFFVLEEKPDAATRKQIEKYAEGSERYDKAGEKKGGDIFAIANALRRADKKALWVNYQRQLAENAAPEAIHGVLFWAAKDMFLKSGSLEQQNRAKNLITRLAELPHEARRQGEELEYALERFVLSGM
ncbi:MAG: hypothetical protein AAB790_00695, partial [Patescibacteria group bacterium]